MVDFAQVSSASTYGTKVMARCLYQAEKSYLLASQTVWGATGVAVCVCVGGWGWMGGVDHVSILIRICGTIYFTEIIC